MRKHRSEYSALDLVAGPSEDQLRLWWLSQAGASGRLVSDEGSQITVLHPGVTNTGAGPDVLDSHLLMDDRETCGPVEFHLRARDWFSHGHGEDAAYRGVILHVVVDPTGGPDLETLVVPGTCLPRRRCPAKRIPSPGEMRGAAAVRMVRKRRQLGQLDEVNPGSHHLTTLGMALVLANGPEKLRILHEAAGILRFHRWPLSTGWSGSTRTRYLGRKLPGWYRTMVLQGGIEEPADPFRDAGDLGHYLVRIQPVLTSVPPVYKNEWIDNVLIPRFSSDAAIALDLWQIRPPARHYGFECRLAAYWACKKPETVQQQQAWIAWWNGLCRNWQCVDCNLIRDVRPLG